jgi:phage gp37-like protein
VVSGAGLAAPGRGLSGTPVSAQDVVLLQAIRDFPSVSVLMSTTPSAIMTVTEQTRLRDLVDQAVLRLRRLEGVEVGDLVGALGRLCAAVGTERTDRAIALFAGRQTAYALRLGVPVADRVVLDATFATRDLVLALQRTPRHLVLVLSSREARLFESVNGTLHPAGTTAFPLRADRVRRSRAGRPRLAEADTADFLRTVDRHLGTHRALHPSPFVVVGPSPVVHAFLAVARNTSRLAGTLAGHHLDAQLTELASLTRPVIQRYLASREQEALELVATRAGQGRVVSGMPAAWLATRTERPQMLAVEETLFYPALVSPDGATIGLSAEVDDPEVIDDAVDELIEHVLIRGAWVAIVGHGALARHGGVALVLR